MDGTLVIVFAGRKEDSLEFAKMVFSYPQVILVTIGNIKEVHAYAEKNDKQVIDLKSIDEVISFFGSDMVLRLGDKGNKFDFGDVGGALKEGGAVTLIFGDENPDTTLDKWVGDIAAVSIIMYELDRLIKLD